MMAKWSQSLTRLTRKICSKIVPDYRKKKVDTVWEQNALDLGRISAFGKVNKRKRLAKKVVSKTPKPYTTNKKDTGWLPHEV
jgi:hypothetical protein